MVVQNKKLFLLILFGLIGFVVFSQGLPPPGAPPPPPGVPIDGGVLLGVFFALAYGVTKLLKKNH